MLLTFFVMSLQACISPPATTEYVPVPGAYGPVQRPAGVERLPIEVGVYYAPEFTSFKHEEYTIGRNKLEIPVGGSSVQHFDRVFSAMFERTVKVDGRPPNVRPKSVGDVSDLAAIIEVRLDDFAYDFRPMSFGPFTADASYRVIVYAPSGQTIASWVVAGSDSAELKFNENGFAFSGERTANAIRMASDQFMKEFNERPEIGRWLAATEDSTSGPRTTSAAETTSPLATQGTARLDGVTIEAALYNQFREGRQLYQSTRSGSQILAVRITVRNAGPHTILIRPSDIYLSPRAGARLAAVSVNRVARRLYQAPGTEGSEVVGSIVNPALGALMTMGEGSAKDSEVRKIADLVRSDRLEDSTIPPSASVSGYVYFEALGIDGNFEEAELLVRLGETTSIENYEAALRVGHGTVSTTEVPRASFSSAPSKNVTKTASAGPALHEEKASTSAPARAASMQTAAAAPALEPGQLSGAELRRNIVGNTSSGKSERGHQFHVYHSANGRMVGNAKLRLYDVGTYTISEDGLYCREWTRWRSGGRDCFKAYRTGDNRIRMKATNYHYESIFVVRPGDPEGLEQRL